MMTNNMRKAVKAANANLKQVYDWLDANNVAEKLTASIDLKLQDAFYSNYKFDNTDKQLWYENHADHAFYRFCDNEYQYLSDWCLENFGLHFNDMIKYTWHSSSFYLDTCFKGGFLDDSSYNIKKEFLYDVIGNDCVDIIGKDGYISLATIRDDFEWHIERGYNLSHIYDYLEWLSDPELIGDIKSKYEDYIKLYDYIAEFKAHQVEDFKSYLDGEYEWYLETLDDVA